MPRARSGVLEAGTYALCANKGKKERIGRLLMMHANNREDVKIARTGDIIAVAGLKDVVTGETLCDERKPIVLERMEFPGARARSPRRAALPPGGCPTRGKASGDALGVYFDLVPDVRHHWWEAAPSQQTQQHVR